MPPLAWLPAAAPRWRRALRALAVTLGVLSAHALLFFSQGSAPQPAAGAAPRSAMTLVLLAGKLPATASADAPAAAAAPAERLAKRVDAPPAAAASVSADGPKAMAEGQSPTAADAVDVPAYATRLPAPASLHYLVQRGTVSGTGTLHWRRQGEAYEMSLEAELQGMPVFGSASRGAIDADGVAPLRYADRRRAREVRAANFQRDAGLISFSGPQVQYPLLPGAQDRLTWMVQLPAIVEADPALASPGASVTLFVVGSRGDGQAWRFEVLGRTPLELPAGAVADALHLRREPQRPYDTRVEVWLDPARQHLPVRAIFTTVPNGQPLELTLSRSEAAPL